MKKEDSSYDTPLKNARRTQPLNGRKVFFFNKDKYGVADAPTKINLPIPGHYEKIHAHKTKYLWVNNQEPSLLPGAIVVPRKEISERLGLREQDV